MTREEQFLQLVHVGVIVHECRKPPRPQGYVPRDIDEVTGDFSGSALMLMSFAQQVVLSGRLPPTPSVYTLTTQFLDFVLDKRGIGDARQNPKEKPDWLAEIGWMANEIEDEEERKTAIGFLTEIAGRQGKR